MLSNLKPVLSFSSSSWKQEFDIIVQGGVYMFHASAAYQTVACMRQCFRPRTVLHQAARTVVSSSFHYT